MDRMWPCSFASYCTPPHARPPGHARRPARPPPIRSPRRSPPPTASCASASSSLRRSPRSSAARPASHDAARRRARHASPVRQRHARSALYRQLRRQDRRAVRGHQCARVGRQRELGRQRARLPELRVPPAVRPCRHPGLRQVLHAHRHRQHYAHAGFPTGRRHPHARLRAARVDRKEPRGRAYDGAPPRELMRMEQPFANHNGGQLAFNPLAAPGSPDFGLLYVGFADGGSGGDPLDLGQPITGRASASPM